MLIEPASLAQVRTGRNGRRILIEEDVLDVARQLRELDESLRVYWNEAGEYFVIVEVLPNGDESLVTTAQELTPALVGHMRQIAKENFAEELERMDRQADRERDHAFAESVGEHGERAAHALRKDLLFGGRIFVPRGI